jgi:hypothetical protein
MSSPATFYRAWQNGTWNHPTLPAINPDPPVDPPPPQDVWFGTTLIGQSYARYKLWTIGGVAARYRQVEYDTIFNGNRGSAVMREFGDVNNMNTWSQTVSNFRSGQPVIYSFKDALPNNGGPIGNNGETAFKQAFRDWMDGRPGGSNVRVWLAFHHEFDNDGNMDNGANNTGDMLMWYERNAWIYEVLQESAYDQNWARNGGWLKFGWITTGTPWQHGRANTSTRSWKTYVDNMAAYAAANVTGLSTITGATIDRFWDFHGCDKYNPNWDGNGPDYYMTWANWSLKFSQAHDYTGLPIVIAEAGSARDLRSGVSVTNKDADRAAWLDSQYQNMVNAGYYDAVTYWRVPKAKGTAQEILTGSFSTQMITPTGYNAEILAAEGALVGGTGSDAQAVCDVHNEWCINSIATSNALGVGPAISYYTGGPA